MDLQLKERNVLITGGTRGIGKAIALMLQQEGANVSVTGRRKEAAEAFQQAHEGIQVYTLDVMNPEERAQLVEQYMSDHGTIDVLVNNVGGSSGSTTQETDLEQFREAFEFNYFQAVDFSKRFASHMVRKESGAIINIASVYGRESGGLVTYNNAKAALISFSKSLSNELIPHGVRVNCIAPGSVFHSDGVWDQRMKENESSVQNFIFNEIPANRLGTPEEIANVVTFLASEKSSWIVGACLTVDGGQSRMNH